MNAKAMIAAPLMLLALAACEPLPPGSETAAAPAPADQPAPAPAPTTTPQSTGTLPESVSSIAAPWQDLRSARLRPADGCFWYTHRGPVETTELPLRTRAGNPICTREQG